MCSSLFRGLGLLQRVWSMCVAVVRGFGLLQGVGPVCVCIVGRLGLLQGLGPVHVSVVGGPGLLQGNCWTRVSGAGASYLATTWRRCHNTLSCPAVFLGFRFAINLYTPFLLKVISVKSGCMFIAVFNHKQVISVFPVENIAELIIEDVFLGPAFTRGKSMPLEGE